MTKEEEIRFEDEQEEDLKIDSVLENDRRLVTAAYDFIVKSLKDQIEDKTIVVDETWQRKYVWDDKKASRLIESLLLNVPIPVCYFAEEEKSGQYLIIDGQQRLWSIYRFLNNQFLLKGLNVLGHLNGKRYHQLEKKEQRLINTRGIRCIVLTQECHPEIRFDVFERLNTGSVQLTPQELRHCMFRGDLDKILSTLSKDKGWLKLLQKKEPDDRLRDQELILRFFALHNKISQYKPPLNRFLNEFMRANREVTPEAKAEFIALFKLTTNNVKLLFGKNPFRRNPQEKTINKALFDIQMLMSSHMTTEMCREYGTGIAKVYSELVKDVTFTDLIIRATDHRLRVQNRFSILCTKLQEKGILIPTLFDKINAMVGR